MDLAIDVQDLCKSFRFSESHSHLSLKEFCITSLKSYFNPFSRLKTTGDSDAHNLILDHVSFRVTKGQAVAFLGKNGSGKSTLLKILSGIYQADSGYMAVNGTLSSLIELGAGFHPDFSGAENVIINGQVLGLSKKEILEKYDEIIEFSGIKAHIHKPVRTYSSGMFLRLAFSVAINVNPDIILIDEIVAVGDSEFQKKCHDKIKEFKEKGRTLLMVSHNLKEVEQLADWVLYLKNGRVVFDGPTKLGIEAYLNDQV